MSKEPDGFSLDDIFNEVSKVDFSHPNKVTLTEKEKIALVKLRASQRPPPSFNYLSKNWTRWFGRYIGRNTLGDLYKAIPNAEKERILNTDKR